jgi:transmembrane sensor
MWSKGMIEPESNERWWSDAERDPIHAAAAKWFTQLQDPQTSIEVTLAWQRWMSEDERHAEAFERIEEAWHALGALAPPPAVTASSAADPYEGSVPLSDYQRPRIARTRRMAFAIAASVVVATCLALLAFNREWPFASVGTRGEVMRTAIGETRSVRLEDGSRIMLGGGTEIDIQLQQDSRRISLLRGEAFFRVARDAARPFIVRAGDAAVTAIGTEFNVRRGGDRVTVAVVEGRVVVERSSPLVPAGLLQQIRPELTPVRVDAGQQTIVDHAGIERATPLPDPGSATAWQTGRLAYQGEALRYVLADVNRYSLMPIVIEDESIGALSITGTIASDNVSEWIASLERAFGLVAVEDSGRIVLKRASAP